MVSIPQHGPHGELHDLCVFFVDIDAYFTIDTWDIRVVECLGEGVEEIERRSASGLQIGDSEFREAYRGIYQTIDGQFSGLLQGTKVVYLAAIDSTSWDIEGTQEFEKHMVKKYGGYAAHDQA